MLGISNDGAQVLVSSLDLEALVRQANAPVATETEGDAQSLLPSFWGILFTAASFLTTTGYESAWWGSARDWAGPAGVAGAAADEVVDPRPYAELMRQWSSFHPEFTYLPRKFKIAVIASAEDRAALRWHDFALRIVQNASGEIGFEVYAGGGMGRTPFIAYKIRDAAPLQSLKVALYRGGKKRRFPSDTEFRDALETRDVYAMRSCAHLLDRLETHFIFGTRIAERRPATEPAGKKLFGARIHDICGWIQIDRTDIVDLPVFFDQLDMASLDPRQVQNVVDQPPQRRIQHGGYQPAETGPSLPPAFRNLRGIVRDLRQDLIKRHKGCSRSDQSTARPASLPDDTIPQPCRCRTGESVHVF